MHSDETLWQHFQWYSYRFQCFCLRFKRLVRPCINFVLFRCHNLQQKNAIHLSILYTLTKSLRALLYILACCLITHTQFCLIAKLVECEADNSQCFLLQFLLADVYRFQDCVKPGSTCYGTYVRAIQVYHKGHNIYPYITLFTHVLINLCKVRTRATQVQGQGQGQATCGDSEAFGSLVPLVRIFFIYLVNLKKKIITFGEKKHINDELYCACLF